MRVQSEQYPSSSAPQSITTSVSARDLDLARLGVRQGPVRAGRHDGVEARPLGAPHAHLLLEVQRHRPLRPSDEAPAHGRLERGVGERRGRADRLQLAGVLDRPQILDETAGRDQLGLGQQLGEPSALLDRDVGVVEPDRRTRRDDPRQGVEELALARLTVEAGNLLGGLGDVAEVRDEAAAGLTDDGEAGAPAEARHPADVHRVGDQQQIELAIGHERGRGARAGRLGSPLELRAQERQRVAVPLDALARDRADAHVGDDRHRGARPRALATSERWTSTAGRPVSSSASCSDHA